MIVDTGVLVAAADEAGPDHPACAALLEAAAELPASPFVVAEAAYLIGRQLGPGAEARFFRSIVGGEIRVIGGASRIIGGVTVARRLGGSSAAAPANCGTA